MSDHIHPSRVSVSGDRYMVTGVDRETAPAQPEKETLADILAEARDAHAAYVRGIARQYSELFARMMMEGRKIPEFMRQEMRDVIDAENDRRHEWMMVYVASRLVSSQLQQHPTKRTVTV